MWQQLTRALDGKKTFLGILITGAAYLSGPDGVALVAENIARCAGVVGTVLTLIGVADKYQKRTDAAAGIIR